MNRFGTHVWSVQALGLLVGGVACLLVALAAGELSSGNPGEEGWGSAARPVRLERVSLPRAAVAEDSDIGLSARRPSRFRVPGSSGVAAETAAPMVKVAAASHGGPAPETLASSEDGKGPGPASAIPFPPVLPSPRVEIPVAPDGGSPVPEGWSLKEFAGKAKLSVEKVGPLFAVHLTSDVASFGLHKDISVDVSQYPYLSWLWRVDKLPSRGDVRRKETDDQAAQLYVVFPRFPAMVRSQIIGYVWDSAAPVGTVINSTTSRLAKIIVVRSGADRLGQWVLETRNVLQDFRRLFGEPPPNVGKISLLINSQHTKSSAESWFAGLTFTRAPLQGDTGMSADGLPSHAERGSGPGHLERAN